MDAYQEALTYYVGKSKASSSTGLLIVGVETSGRSKIEEKGFKKHSNKRCLNIKETFKFMALLTNSITRSKSSSSI